ncbi:MAG: ribose 5-phosphate isomerase B [Parabacteroides sp.]|nr:ribose 5-phosphate isomerase B [Parabacteroides sp.]MDD4403997.1 ribose 5-phosphate isomerase B [Parabacteroides sp.]
MKKLGICSDHAGYELKEYLKQVLDEKGIAYQDFGTYSAESSDYPDFAHPMALAIESGEVYPGIAMCGSGNGIAMTLNKHQGIRAAISWEAELARLGRAHNDANVVVLPARFISREEAKKVIEAFLETPFEGGRHEKRICKIPV